MQQDAVINNNNNNNNNNMPTLHSLVRMAAQGDRELVRELKPHMSNPGLGAHLSTRLAHSGSGGDGGSPEHDDLIGYSVLGAAILECANSSHGSTAQVEWLVLVGKADPNAPAGPNEEVPLELALTLLERTTAATTATATTSTTTSAPSSSSSSSSFTPERVNRLMARLLAVGAVPVATMLSRVLAAPVPDDHTFTRFTLLLDNGASPNRPWDLVNHAPDRAYLATISRSPAEEVVQVLPPPLLTAATLAGPQTEVLHALLDYGIEVEHNTLPLEVVNQRYPFPEPFVRTLLQVISPHTACPHGPILTACDECLEPPFRARLQAASDDAIDASNLDSVFDALLAASSNPHGSAQTPPVWNALQALPPSASADASWVVSMYRVAVHSGSITLVRRLHELVGAPPRAMHELVLEIAVRSPWLYMLQWLLGSADSPLAPAQPQPTSTTTTAAVVSATMLSRLLWIALLQNRVRMVRYLLDEHHASPLLHPPTREELGNATHRAASWRLVLDSLSPQDRATLLAGARGMDLVDALVEGENPAVLRLVLGALPPGTLSDPTLFRSHTHQSVVRALENGALGLVVMLMDAGDNLLGRLGASSPVGFSVYAMDLILTRGYAHISGVHVERL